MRRIVTLVIALGFAMAAAGCSGRATAPADVTGRTVETGIASYYTQGVGRTTASGQRFDHDALTAAHRTLPFGTRVRVTNLVNGRSVVVTINDRGPTSRSRLIDLSLAAARQLDMIEAGITRVRVAVVVPR